MEPRRFMWGTGRSTLLGNKNVCLHFLTDFSSSQSFSWHHQWSNSVPDIITGEWQSCWINLCGSSGVHSEVSFWIWLHLETSGLLSLDSHLSGHDRFAYSLCQCGLRLDVSHVRQYYVGKVKHFQKWIKNWCRSIWITPVACEVADFKRKHLPLSPQKFEIEIVDCWVFFFAFKCFIMWNKI